MTRDRTADGPTGARAEPLSDVVVDTAALAGNIRALRAAANNGGRPLCCPMVKGNAYGHGLLIAARAFLQAGAEWLGVGEVAEAQRLADAGIAAPTLAVCHVPPEQAEQAVALGMRLTVYDDAVIDALSAASRRLHRPARVHLKIETGTNRQGVGRVDALRLSRRIAADPHLLLEGVSTHFADIEDTTDHRFAKQQLARFHATVADIRAVVSDAGADPRALLVHASNTAAVLLWPEVCGDLVRFGIGAYGLWPSKETFVSAQLLGRTKVALRPALTWRTRIVQVKDVPVGEWVGYGRTFRAVRPSRVAVLPVGYYDGYDRGLSNLAEVLVAGQRARVVGRVAMNMVTIDVTDNPHARPGAEVVLLGSQRGAAGQDTIGAGEMAAWLGTIHYEVTTRIREGLPRTALPTP